MATCIDPAIGVLLHAYEIGGLSETERDCFEIHLMNCEFCFDEVKRFADIATVLRSDSRVLEVLQESEKEETTAESLAQKLKGLFWPDAPLIFRPAFAYIVIILMMIPAYLGLQRIGERNIGPVQPLHLVTDRSGGEAVLDLSRGIDGLLSFYYRNAEEGKQYIISIVSESGEVIFEDDRFSGFDEFGTGHLILSSEATEAGHYRLSITNPHVTPPDEREYRFSVEK